MEVNRTNMNIFFSGLKSLFDSAAGVVEKEIKLADFCSIESSTGAADIYRVFERFGGLREWVGARKLNNIKSSALTVVNRDFEDNMVIRRNDIEDDQLGGYRRQIQEMGRAAALIWYELATAALAGGKTAKWADGKPFFSSDRKYDKSPINNLFALELNADNYAAVRVAMRQYKDGTGRPGRVRPDTLFVGPENEKTAREILDNTAVMAIKSESGEVSTVGNVWAGSAKLVVLDELGKEWFLADCSRPVKPVLVQQRRKPELVAKDRPDDDRAFLENEYVYGVSARGAAALSYPHLIAASFPA